MNIFKNITSNWFTTILGLLITFGTAVKEQVTTWEGFTDNWQAILGGVALIFVQDMFGKSRSE